LVSALVNKESVKLTFTYFDSFPIEIYFDKEEKCARFLEICEYLENQDSKFAQMKQRRKGELFIVRQNLH
jgi:hypothetical protein